VVAAWWVLQWGSIVEVAISQLAVAIAFVPAFIIFVHRKSLPWSLSELAPQIYGSNLVLLITGSALVFWKWEWPVLPLWTFLGSLLLLFSLLALLAWSIVLLPVHRQRLRNLLAARRSQAAG